jgi:uncharacterized protein (DUF111 family)
MLLGALLDLGASLEIIQEGWRRLPFPPIDVARHRVDMEGYTATQIAFEMPTLDAFPVPPTYTRLCDAIRSGELPHRVQQRLLDILTRFANAARRLQDDLSPAPDLMLPATGLSELLYLGSGVAMALDDLKITECQAAPLNLGSSPAGQHLVPHPLTAELVRDVPVYGDPVPGERTTIDGAAILTALATQYGPLPAMSVCQTGYGASTATSTPQHVQVMVGDVAGDDMSDRIAILEANIDDMNPEFYADIFARLFAHGALDVTLTPLFMKKNRPANKLTVLSPPTQVSTLSRLMLRETSTFGVRIYEAWRQKLDRFWREVDTQYGVIPVKCGVLDGRIVQAAPEYDACQRLAHEHHIPVRLVYTSAMQIAASWLTDTDQQS